MGLSAEETQALWLSAKVALCATAVCLPPAIALAWWLERRRFPGRFLVDALVQLPMVLPPVVPGYLLLLLLGTQGPLGHWLQAQLGIVIAFTWKGAALASAVMAFPLMVQPIRIAFRLIDARLEQAAATLGARPAEVFGFADRGRIEAGMRADLMVFDPQTVGPGRLELREDLPSGGRRLFSAASGVHQVWVNGTRTLVDGEVTGARPGQLLRRG